MDGYSRILQDMHDDAQNEATEDMVNDYTDEQIKQARQQMREKSRWLSDRIIDPHTEWGKCALLTLPDGTVLIDYTGRAAQIYFEETDGDYDDLHQLHYAGTEPFVNLVHSVPPEPLFIVVYIPGEDPATGESLDDSTCVGGWATCELCGHRREAAL